jgi:hypothetical protein
MTALVAAVSITAMAGCSSIGKTTGGNTSTGNTNTGSGGLTPASVVLAALTKASSDNSVTITGTVTGGTAGITTKMQGVEQFQPLKSALTIDTSGGTSAGMSLSAIYDGTDYYIKSPALSALEGGKTWLELNLASLGTGSSNPLASLMGSLNTQSPTGELSALLGSGDLKSVGSQTIGGVQATHYTGTLTAAQAADLAAVNGLTAADVAQIKSLFSASGIQTETMDVWVGPDNLPVQVVSTTTSTSLGSTTSTFDFTNWGAPVTITDPPAGQVGTFSIPTS